MSFWSRLFGRKKDSAHPARSPRVRLLLADGARFESPEGVFPLVNISESGVGLLAEDGFPVGWHAGSLHLGDRVLPVNLEVVRRSGNFAGARFKAGEEEVHAALRQLFLEEFRAIDMNEVRVGALDEKKIRTGHPRWFYAAGNYELFYVDVNGRPERLEMEWNGRVIAAARGEGARIGALSPENREKAGVNKSNLVQWEGPLSEDQRTKAIRILENVTGLDPSVRGLLVELLREPPATNEAPSFDPLDEL